MPSKRIVKIANRPHLQTFHAKKCPIPGQILGAFDNEGDKFRRVSVADDSDVVLGLAVGRGRGRSTRIILTTLRTWLILLVHHNKRILSPTKIQNIF